MYEEERHRQRWKLIAKRLWKQRNEAKESVLRLIDLIANEKLYPPTPSARLRLATENLEKMKRQRDDACAEGDTLRTELAYATRSNEERGADGDQRSEEQNNRLAELALSWSEEARLARLRGAAERAGTFRAHCDSLLEALGLSQPEAEMRSGRYPF